ncbi:hypothetical protein Cgig2_008426 [Carnegiea gigantea]|uniref:Uncharacterized protein n=1 Tax=Carnegiea gigantea TaxID=171969 RepID=A0A9Q1JJW0_9CARY|nr:hypothetical protein Cgig2_008426 [Carnegiea gigantea]
MVVFRISFHALGVNSASTKSCLKMGFPHSLKTDEMPLCAFENFNWYRREVAFPLLPLPSDYENLFIDFDLAVAEEATQNFGLPEIPQVVFLAILLNDVVKLGVLHGWLTDALHPEIGNSHEVEESSVSGSASPLPNDDVRVSFGLVWPADYVVSAQLYCPARKLRCDMLRLWHLRLALRSPHLLLKEHRDLYPDFTLSDTEEAMHNFSIP